MRTRALNGWDPWRLRSQYWGAKGLAPLQREQRQNILVAYCSLQAGDARELLENPKQKPKEHYQQRVAALLGYSTKTVGLVYRDWHHQQEIQVAMPPANRLPKQQRIPKSNDVLLAVRTHVREKRSRNERFFAVLFWVFQHFLGIFGLRRVVCDENILLLFPLLFAPSVGARGLLLFSAAVVVSGDLGCKELAFSLETVIFNWLRLI